jgi:chemotaxis protein CheX
MIETLTNLASHRETAVHVAQEIFSTMLAIETWPVERAPGHEQAHTVVGAIHFAGPWKGVLLLECQPLQAAAFTAKLMGIAPPDNVDDDVRDAIGEVANMLAGNLKSILPSGTALSAHTVVEGSSFTMKVGGGNDSLRIEFDSSAGPFSVTLVQMVDKSSPK